MYIFIFLSPAAVTGFSRFSRRSAAYVRLVRLRSAKRIPSGRVIAALRSITNIRTGEMGLVIREEHIEHM